MGEGWEREKVLIIFCTVAQYNHIECKTVDIFCIFFFLNKVIQKLGLYQGSNIPANCKLQQMFCYSTKLSKFIFFKCLCVI